LLTAVSCVHGTPYLRDKLEITNMRMSVMVQYMVVYQLLVSLAVNSAFFLDGSWFSTHQVIKVNAMQNRKSK